MPPHADQPEHDDWVEIDPEGPLPEDLDDDDDDETPTVPCPKCQTEISDLADRCPHCGEWIEQSAGPPGPTTWIIAVTLFVLLIFLLMYAV